VQQICGAANTAKPAFFRMDAFKFYDVLGKGTLSRSTVIKTRKRKSTQHFAVVKCPIALQHLVRRNTSVTAPRRCTNTQVENNVQVLYTLKGDHNIVQFDSWYTTGSHAWQVVELCDGGSLAHAIRSDGALPENHIQMLAAGILAGLCASHHNGIIMAALHPSAVLLGSDGRPKLSDFKLSSAFHICTPPSRDVTAALPYLAPEYSSHQPSSAFGVPATLTPPLHASTPPLASGQDIWSFGCLLYESLYGFSPFDHSSTAPPHASRSPPELLKEPPSQARHQVPHGRALQLPFLPTAAELVAARTHGGYMNTTAPITPQRARATDGAMGAPPHTHPTLAMQHLLSTCLHPDPAQRASLEHLCQHPFFMVSAQLADGGGVDAVTVAPTAPDTPPDEAMAALLKVCWDNGYSPPPMGSHPGPIDVQGGSPHAAPFEPPAPSTASGAGGGALGGGGLVQPPQISRMSRSSADQGLSAAAVDLTAASAISQASDIQRGAGGGFFNATFELSLDTSGVAGTAGPTGPLSAFPVQGTHVSASASAASGQFSAPPPAPLLQQAQAHFSETSAAVPSPDSGDAQSPEGSVGTAGASPNTPVTPTPSGTPHASPARADSDTSSVEKVEEDIKSMSQSIRSSVLSPPGSVQDMSSPMKRGEGGSKSHPPVVSVPPPPTASPLPRIEFLCVPVEVTANTLGALDSTPPPDDHAVAPIVGSPLLNTLIKEAAPMCPGLDILTLHFRVFHAPRSALDVGGLQLLQRGDDGKVQWVPPMHPDDFGANDHHLPSLQQLNLCKQRNTKEVHIVYAALKSACLRRLGTVTAGEPRTHQEQLGYMQCMAAVALASQRAPLVAEALMQEAGARGAPLYLLTSTVARLSHGQGEGLSPDDQALLTACLGALAVVCRYSEQISSGLFHDGTDDTLWHALVFAMQEGMIPPLTHLSGVAAAACLLLCEAAFVAGGSPGGQQLRAPPSVAWALHAGAALALATAPARSAPVGPCMRLMSAACIQTLCNIASVTPPQPQAGGVIIPVLGHSAARPNESATRALSSTDYAVVSMVLDNFPWADLSPPVSAPNRPTGDDSSLHVSTSDDSSSIAGAYLHAGTALVLCGVLSLRTAIPSAAVAAGALGALLRSSPALACVAVDRCACAAWVQWVDWGGAADSMHAALRGVLAMAAARNTSAAFPSKVQFRPPTATRTGRGAIGDSRMKAGLSTDAITVVVRTGVLVAVALCVQDAAAAAAAAVSSRGPSDEKAPPINAPQLPTDLHRYVEVICDMGSFCVLDAVQGGAVEAESRGTAAPGTVQFHACAQDAHAATQQDDTTIHLPLAWLGVLSRIVAYGAMHSAGDGASGQCWGAAGLLVGMLRGAQKHLQQDCTRNTLRLSQEAFALDASSGGGGTPHSPPQADAVAQYIGDDAWLETAAEAFAKGVQGGYTNSPSAAAWSAACSRLRQVLGSVGGLREWEPCTPPSNASDGGVGQWCFDVHSGSKLGFKCVATAAESVLVCGAEMFAGLQERGTGSLAVLGALRQAIGGCQVVIALEGAPGIATGDSPVLASACSCLAAAASQCSASVRWLASSAAGSHVLPQDSSTANHTMEAFQDVTGMVVELATWCEGLSGPAAAAGVPALNQAVVQSILVAAIQTGTSKNVPASARGISLYTLLQVVGWRGSATAPLIVAQGGLPVAVGGVKSAAETLFAEHKLAVETVETGEGGGISIMDPPSLVPLHDSVQLLHSLMSQGQVNSLRAVHTHDLGSCFLAALRAVLCSRLSCPLLGAGRCTPPLDDMEGGAEDALQSLQYLLLAITDCAFEVSLMEHMAPPSTSFVPAGDHFDTSVHGSLHLPATMGTPPRPTSGGLRMSGGGLDSSVASHHSAGGLSPEQKGAAAVTRLLRTISPLLVHVGTWFEVHRRAAAGRTRRAGPADGTEDTMGTLSEEGIGGIHSSTGTPLEVDEDVLGGLISNVSNAATRLLVLAGKASNTRPFIALALASWGADGNDRELVQLGEGMLGGGVSLGLPHVGELSVRAESPLVLLLHGLTQGSRTEGEGVKRAAHPHTQSRLLKLLHLLLRPMGEQGGSSDSQGALKSAIMDNMGLSGWLARAAEFERVPLEQQQQPPRRGGGAMATAVLRLLGPGAGERVPELRSTSVQAAVVTPVASGSTKGGRGGGLQSPARSRHSSVLSRNCPSCDKEECRCNLDAGI